MGSIHPLSFFFLFTNGAAAELEPITSGRDRAHTQHSLSHLNVQVLGQWEETRAHEQSLRTHRKQLTQNHLAVC